MKIMAIDGAARRNGKPDCVSAGGVFVLDVLTTPAVKATGSTVYEVLEHNSTNQRGELKALALALDIALVGNDKDVTIVTDSEYIFNTMTKRWYDNWSNNNWRGASGDKVKNADLWINIAYSMDCCEEDGLEVTFYHIKGHCISFGKVTANKLLEQSYSGAELYRAIWKKFDEQAPKKQDVFEAAQELSLTNNGFKLSHEVFKRFVVMNTVADAIATKLVEEADARREM